MVMSLSPVTTMTDIANPMKIARDLPRGHPRSNSISSLTRIVVPSFRAEKLGNVVDYDKIVRFLSSHHTSQQFDRHLAIVERLVCIYESDGVNLQDWAHIGKVFSNLQKLIASGLAQLLPSVKKLLDVFR